MAVLVNFQVVETKQLDGPWRPLKLELRHARESQVPGNGIHHQQKKTTISTARLGPGQAQKLSTFNRRSNLTYPETWLALPTKPEPNHEGS